MIYVGTSIGALQAAYLAQRATDGIDEVLRGGLKTWQGLRIRDGLSSPLSAAQLRLVLRYLGRAFGLRVRPPPSFLATKRLKQSVGEKFGPFDRIHANIEKRCLHSVAVVATSSATGRTVVFHDGGQPVERCDNRRGIDYVPTTLTLEHVLASTAIPSLLPAVCIGGPDHPGWCVDGGTRLNAPIKPAIKLGAARLVIVGLNSNRPGPEPESPQRPDAIHGAAHITQAILADPLHNDLQTLVTLNRAARDAAGRLRYKVIPYIYIAPESRDRIGALAADVFRKHYTGLHGLGARRIRFIGRLVDARSDPAHGELLSYLFFAPEFVHELFELGKQDTRRWLKGKHDDHPWRTFLSPP
jgi:NTE family protein